MRDIRCNRCGQTEELFYHGPNNPKPAEPSNWFQMNVKGYASHSDWYDLCPSCAEAFIGKFLKGEALKAVTKPAETGDESMLTHEPTLDCHWLINPGTGMPICVHDDSELVGALLMDMAARKIRAGEDVSDEELTSIDVAATLQKTRETLENGPEPVDPPWEKAKCTCDDHIHTYNSEVGPNCLIDVCDCQVAPGGAFDKNFLPINTDTGPLTQVSASLRATNERNEKAIREFKAAQQHCTPACSEQHTYKDGCLLSVIYTVPAQRESGKGQS